MRKRNDASKPPVIQRVTARNSSVARRGEEKSLLAGKEQSKVQGTFSNTVEEKASEPMKELLSPKRPSIKREVIMALEAPQLKPVPSMSKDAIIPQALQANAEALPIDTSIHSGRALLETDGQAVSDVPLESETKTDSSFAKEFVKSTENLDGISADWMEKQVPTFREGTQAHVSSVEIPFEVRKEKVIETSCTDPLETAASTETLPSASVFNIPEVGKPDKAEAGQLDLSKAYVPDESEFGNALEAKKPNALKSDSKEVRDSGASQMLPVAGTEIQHADFSQATQDANHSSELQIMSKSGAENGNTVGQDNEGAASTPNFARETSSVVGGGEDLTPLRLHTQEFELNHSQLTAGVHPLLPQADEHGTQVTGSTESILKLSSIQQAQSAQEPLAADLNSELITASQTDAVTEAIRGDAQASNVLSLGRVGDNSFSSSVAKSHKTEEDKASTHKDASSVFHIENTFTRNMVSCVEGETVLIVENLGALLESPTKPDTTLSGTADVSRVVDGQQEKQVHTKCSLDAEKGLVGRKVRKNSGKKFLDGKIVQYESDANLFKVVYEDGNEEELDVKEVRKQLADKELLLDNELHGQPSGDIDSLNRNEGQAIEVQTLAVSHDTIEDRNQLQEKVQVRSLKRRHVIDTSNDAKTDTTDSDDQLSVTSDETSEDDDDEDVTIGGKRRSRKKPKAKMRGKKRKKLDNKTDVKKPFTARIGSRAREESHETSGEHRIATRRSTGALNTRMNLSSDQSLSSNKKAHNESQKKLRSVVQSPKGSSLLGRKTKKDFGGQFYYGEIVHYDNRVKYYKVRYEDGDEEELEWGELAPTLIPQEKEPCSYITGETSEDATVKSLPARRKDHSNKKTSTVKGKEAASIPHNGVVNNGESTNLTRKWRKRVRTASVSVMMKDMDNWNSASTSSATAYEPPPRPLAAVRFASASDADVFEYFGWGEAVNFDRSKCPEVRATHLLPTSSPVVHIAASRHHLAALTAAGQVWVWRCKHGNIHTRCNEWEHVAALDNQNVILVDISGPDVDRVSAGYEPEQEDQVPDPFYLAAVCRNGEDIILQGSEPHDSVHTYQFNGELQYPGLREAVLQSGPDWLDNMGQIVQVSVGTVEAADESPFVGYITHTDCVFIRSATKDFMEEVNLVTGFTGKPLKIQCGRVYHAIILTDDGRAWTWGQGYYPGSNVHSAGFANKWSSPFSVCQPAMGTLVGRKVIDVGCYGEDFIALTNDGDVHQWTHALPNPAAGVYNVPATPVYGQRPNIGSGDKLKQVAIGAGICAGISDSGKVHTWRTPLKGGYENTVGLLEGEAATPLCRDEGTDTAILALGTRAATKVICVAGSLLVVVKRKYRARRGGKRKLDASAIKGKSTEDEGIIAEGEV